ncbi:MAG: Eco57I restriction-modification methylase domain-containing protein [Gemmatimonadaceae bacterium]
MRTLRSAAARLAAAGGLADLLPIATELGFVAAPVPLDAAARAALTLPVEVCDAAVAAGQGALRALLLELDPAAPLRDTLGRVAARLAARVPHVLWLLVAAPRAGTHVGIASWNGPAERRSPRVVALVADRAHVVDSDAETLLALAAAASSASDVLTHARWVEVLGRDALSRRFYRELERRVSALADGATCAATDRVAREERAEIALLYTSRLLFLAFLQAKGWLDGDRAFLEGRFDSCMASGGEYHRRVLRPLFFGTLNTRLDARAAAARGFGRVPFLNGGLFAPTTLERRARGFVFADESLGALFGELLSRYRFTAREDRGTWSEAAIDPEMLGRAFESLMAARARRDSGAFFTPQALVEHLTERALTQALREVVSRVGSNNEATALLRGELPAAERRSALLDAVNKITVLDPACGSGAFLVHILERLAELARAAGDPRPVSDIRRDVLTRAIFGVDRNPTAVWLCELRLWLSVVIESDEADPLRVPALPNLDRNVRVGDSLAGDTFDVAADPRPKSPATLGKLRQRYVRAAGPQKEVLGKALEREERRRAIERIDAELRRLADSRRERLIARRTPDLFGERHAPGAAERSTAAELRSRAAALRRERTRLADGGALPFSFPVHFADVGERGGFDVVIGNPPWVRVHRIPSATRAALRRQYAVFRDAGWDTGATAAHAGRGFAAQVDLAALFAERSLRLLRPGGTLALLLPAKLWRSLAGGGLRRLLHHESTVTAVEDWSEARAAFDAAVYPSILVASRTRATRGASERVSIDVPLAVTIHLRDRAISWTVLTAGMEALDTSPGSPWVFLPPQARAAFNRLRTVGVPLAESRLGRPHLGVKCGCNEAFVVTPLLLDGAPAGLTRVTDAHGRRGCVESHLLRPVLRGEEVRAWAAAPHEHMLWPHSDDGRPLAALPRHAARWLAPWQARLSRRTDLRGRDPWWSVFRIEAASSATPRVVWADLARGPRAVVLGPRDPTVPLNTCYVVPCPSMTDAHTLAALLNSPIVAAWLDPLAEPARGGYRRYLGWTTALLPIPARWSQARVLLAPLGERACVGDPPSPRELLAATLQAYGVGPSEVAPLLTWKDP